jgi:hypothetical protein
VQNLEKAKCVLTREYYGDGLNKQQNYLTKDELQRRKQNGIGIKTNDPDRRKYFKFIIKCIVQKLFQSYTIVLNKKH